MALQPLPTQGVAVFPQYVSSERQIFKIKGEVFSRDYTIDHDDGRPFLLVDAKGMSLSHRKTISDAATGQTVLQIRRHGFGGRYYAETENGGKLFDIEKDSLGTSRFSLHLSNAEAGGRPESLQYKSDSHWMPRDGTVSWQDMPVSIIKKNGLFKSTFVVDVAPGVDPVIVIGLMIVIEDVRQTRRSRAARGGAST